MRVPNPSNICPSNYLLMYITPLTDASVKFLQKILTDDPKGKANLTGADTKPLSKPESLQLNTPCIIQQTKISKI